MTLLLVQGCALSTMNDNYCMIYKPVPTLHCGSDFQQLRVDQNNAAHEFLCNDL